MKMVMEFDENGKIKMPETVEIKKFDKKLILKFIGSEIDESVTCEFEMRLPESNIEIEKKIWDIKIWADKHHQLEDEANIMLEKDGENYQLVIIGKGADGRCAWCRSFRTALKKAMFDLKIDLIKEGSCKFE